MFFSVGVLLVFIPHVYVYVYPIEEIPQSRLHLVNVISSVDSLLKVTGCFAIFKAKQYFQTTADSLLSVDTRKPVLFLRAFDDDEKMRFAKWQVGFLDFSLETRLSNHFRHRGPFIAVGSPTETVPIPGAARVRLPDSEWQDRVLGWIGNAIVIIVYAGKTHWVNWELARIIETGRAQNLILMMPEFGKRRRLWWQDLGLRIDRMRDVLKNTVWSNTFAEIQDFQDVRALLFGNDGSMMVIRSRYRNRDSYHLAALVAHYILLNEPHWRLAKVTVQCPNCRTGLRLPAGRSGQVRCPTCSVSFQANT